MQDTSIGGCFWLPVFHLYIHTPFCADEKGDVGGLRIKKCKKEPPSPGGKQPSLFFYEDYTRGGSQLTTACELSRGRVMSDTLLSLLAVFHSC